MSYVLTFDCEFTGPNPFIHHMIDIGATLYEVNTMTKIGAGFNTIVNMPPEAQWAQDTIKDFWEVKVSQKHYENVKTKAENCNAIDMKEAIGLFHKYIHMCYEQTHGDMFMGSNRLEVDAFWINYQLCKYGFQPLNKTFGTDTRLIDVNSYHQGLALILNDHVRNFENSRGGFDPSEAALKAFGVLLRPLVNKNHSAVEDAENLAQMVCLVNAGVMGTQKSLYTKYEKYKNFIH